MKFKSLLFTPCEFQSTPTSRKIFQRSILCLVETIRCCWKNKKLGKCYFGRNTLASCSAKINFSVFIRFFLRKKVGLNEKFMKRKLFWNCTQKSKPEERYKLDAGSDLTGLSEVDLQCCCFYLLQEALVRS